MNNLNKFTSIYLSKKLYKKGFIFDYDFIWKRGELVSNGNQHPPFTEYQWDLIEDDGTVGFNDRAYQAYDILNDLCVKYTKELFGEILLKREEYPIFSQDDDVCWSFFHHPEMVLSFLQQNLKEEAEKYIIENIVCKKCKGTGSYKIPVSSPIMAPYGKDDTTSVPCECKIAKK